MKIGDWLIIVLTFFTGLVAGSVVYLSGFQAIDIEPKQNESIAAYTVEVRQYGGCTLGGGCNTYRVSDEGEYILIDGSGRTKTGTLAPDQRDSLTRVLMKADLVSQEQLIQPDFCESWVDGIDLEYSIVRNQVNYRLDTCGTAVDVDSDLIELLDWLWVLF